MYIFAFLMYKYTSMNSKTKRIIVIKQLIQQYKISSQEDLLEKLKKEGFEYTQATLSRDLNFLKTIKVPDENGNYIYSLPENGNSLKNENNRLPLKGFISIEFSNQLAVIKTNSGYATGIASTIDSANIFEILGTVAGDDTIIVIPREGVKKSDVVNSLISNFSELEDKLKH